jgi:hypothetical protein
VCATLANINAVNAVTNAPYSACGRERASRTFSSRFESANSA